MGRFIDLQNKKFTYLTVIKRVENKGNKTYWLCECKCGKFKEVNSNKLISNIIKSCGCFARENTIKRSTKHGLCYSSEYKSYNHMLDRCLNKNHKNWNTYGGKGITICKEWIESFDQFYKDMGPKPTGLHSIDRINCDEGYSKENCRWATKAEQAQNRLQHKKKINQCSKYFGVTKRESNKFRARIDKNNIKYELGTFENETEAALAYNNKALELYGPNARLNKI